MENSVHHSDIIYKCLRALNLCQVFSRTIIRRVMAVLISTFSLGYNRKAVNFSSHSPCHRTTLAHFLNQGKWDSPVWKTSSRHRSSKLSGAVLRDCFKTEWDVIESRLHFGTEAIEEGENIRWRLKRQNYTVLYGRAVMRCVEAWMHRNIRIMYLLCCS